MKQLSVIIPHFNSANSLRVLLSTIPQDKEVEVIVIDDNSTKFLDELYQIENDFENKNIIFLKNTTKNQSAGTCRNIGLDAANGKWVLFADADDYFVHDFYDKVIQFYDSKHDVVIFNPTSIYLDTKEKASRHIKYEQLIYNYLERKKIEDEVKFRYEFGVPWSKLIKMEIIRKHNLKFDEVINRNDKMFSTQLGYYMKNFHVSTDTIYCVTRNKGSLTMIMTEKAFDSSLDVFIRNNNFIIKKLSKEERKYLSLSGLSVLLSALKANLGLSKVIKTYKILKQNKIKIFDRRFLNPIFILNRGKLYFKDHLKEKKYYSK